MRALCGKNVSFGPSGNEVHGTEKIPAGSKPNDAGGVSWLARPRAATASDRGAEAPAKRSTFSPKSLPDASIPMVSKPN